MRSRTFALVSAFFVCNAASAQAADFSGAWQVTASNGPVPLCTFAQKGEVLTGTCVGPATQGEIKGTAKDDTLEWTWIPLGVKFSGKLASPTSLTGDVIGVAGTNVGTFTASKGAKTNTVAQTPNASFDKSLKTEVVTKAGTEILSTYVFPDRAEQAKAKIDAALAAGAYDSINDPATFAQRLTEDLQSVTHDKHMRVFYQGTPIPQTAPAIAPPPQPPPMSGGFTRVDRLKGNIGYIKLNAFPPPAVFNSVADTAMRDLAGTDALIIDLRDNGGGSPETVAYLVGFFFDPAKPFHENDFVNRTPSSNEFTTTEFWTKAIASPYLGKPVYLLTSSRTFSGGEGFAYSLQAQKRVTIYGETTGGGANPGGMMPIGPRFAIFVPNGRARNPVTKTNWEGVGVVPDHGTDGKLAFQAAMSDAFTKLLASKRNDAALTEVKTALASQTEEAPFVEAAFLKIRTTASPGAEAALRNFLVGRISGQVPYDLLTPELANVVRSQPWPYADWGALKSIAFSGVGPAGADIYMLEFEKAKVECRMLPLIDGKISQLSFNKLS